MSTSSPTAATPCRSSAWPARSRRSPAPRCACRRPTRSRTSAAVADLLAVEVRDPAWCPRFVGRWVDGVTRRPVAGPRPDAPPGGRPAADQQRRRRQQLRHARARQADPHVRRRRRRRRATVSTGSSSAGRAPGERLETLDHVAATSTPRRPAHRRRAAGRSGSPGSWAARLARSATPRRAGHRRVGDLRPDHHPPDRPALRPPLRGEPAVREGPGVPPRPARRRPGRPADRRVGRRRRAPAAGSTRAPTSRRSTRGRLPAGTRQPPARHDLSARTSSALLARVGVATETAPAGAPDRAIRRRASRGRSRSTPARGEAARRRSSRPGGATSRSRPTSTEEVARVRGYDTIPAILPHTPMPPYRRSPLADPRLASARPWPGAGLTETVSHALVAPAAVERFAWSAELPVAAGSDRPGAPDRR